MARYRKIDPRIWNDAKFSALSSEGKLLFLYLLTAPAMTMIGAMPMRASAVAEELGFDSKRYAIRYQELSQMGIVEYDDRGLFWVKNFLKYNAPDNPKVVISWGNVLDLLPECPLLTKVLKSAQAHCLQRGEGYAEAFKKSFGNGIAYGMPNPMPYQEQEQEQEQEKEVGGGNAPIPSVDEFGLAGEVASSNAKTKKPKAITHPLDLESIPDDYTEYCQEVRPDLVPARVFAAFKAYWTKGKGKGTLKSDKNWFQSWMNWVKKEDEARTRNTKPVAVEEFSDDRYANAMNPDGSLNWD